MEPISQDICKRLEQEITEDAELDAEVFSTEEREGNEEVDDT